METKIAVIITVIAIILSLTVGLLLSPGVAEYNKQHNIEWGSGIQNTCTGGYAFQKNTSIKLLSDKNIETLSHFDLTFEGEFIRNGEYGVKDCSITDIDILNKFITEVKINDNKLKEITTIYESTNSNKTKFTLRDLNLKDIENVDVNNFNITFQFTTPVKRPRTDEYRVRYGNKYDMTFKNFKSYELNPSPEVPVIEPPFTKPDLPIDKPETKPEQGISGIEVALITTGVLIVIIILILVGFTIWDNKKPIEQQRKPRSKHYLETKTDKELELIITAPTNKHTKDKAKEILDNRNDNYNVKNHEKTTLKRKDK